MYAAFFGLSQPPFSIAPDPRYLFMSEHHREALAHLLYGVESGGGFVLLTGEIGAGKTTVCRRFLEQVPEQARVAYIFNPKLTATELLQTICHEFGVETPHVGPGATSIKEYLDPLNGYLLQSHARGEHNVLIVDEAQALSIDVLEQLRLLTNLETNQDKLLQIVLIGQPELRQMLARPELEQLAQRVIARFHLGALSPTETQLYVIHRMQVAGWQGDAPFSADALQQMHQLTGGVPRRINLLCDRALLGAYAGSTQRVTAAIVRHAAQEVFDLPGKPQGPAFGWKTLAVGTVAGAAAVLAIGTAWLWRSFPPKNPAAASEERLQPKVALAAPTPSAARPGASPKSARAAPLPPEKTAPIPPAKSPDVFLGLPPSSAWIPQEDLAFSVLAPLWGAALSTKQPCTEAQQKGLQCYRTPRMTAHGLQRMNRPALLKLYQPGKGSGYVLATALAGDTIELRDTEGQRWHTPLSSLGSAWHGYYASLWRTPPGQKNRLNNGYDGSAAIWMGVQLDRWQAAGRLPSTAKTLKDKVKAFQRANGIEVNGIADTTTLILINLASGIEEPRLLASTP